MMSSIQNVKLPSVVSKNNSPEHSGIGQKINKLMINCLKKAAINSKPLPLAPPEMSPSEFENKVVKAKEQIAKLTELNESLSKKIEQLGGFRGGGIRRGGVVVSLSKEPLGSLETKIYALEKDINQKRFYIRSLEARQPQ